MDIISYKKTDVIYRDLEDIIVIKNIRCNEMLTLEDVSADIWRFLVNNNSVKLSEIVSYISEDYGINQNEIVDDIKTFICDLYYAGVVLIDGKYADIELSKDSTQLYIDDGFEGEIIKIYEPSLESVGQILCALPGKPMFKPPQRSMIIEMRLSMLRKP